MSSIHNVFPFSKQNGVRTLGRWGRPLRVLRVSGDDISLVRTSPRHGRHGYRVHGRRT